MGKDSAQSFLRGCTDRDVRNLVARALDQDLRFRVTKSGIILYGPHGSVSAHRTPSDRRGVMNLRSSMRRAGINID